MLPSLTTMAVNPYKMGQILAETILKRINETESHKTTYLNNPELIIETQLGPLRSQNDMRHLGKMVSFLANYSADVAARHLVQFRPKSPDRHHLRHHRDTGLFQFPRPKW